MRQQMSFLDTTAEFGELVAAIFAFVAAFERRRIAERIRAGLARARAEGMAVDAGPAWWATGKRSGACVTREVHQRDLRTDGAVARDCAAGLCRAKILARAALRKGSFFGTGGRSRSRHFSGNHISSTTYVGLQMADKPDAIHGAYSGKAQTAQIWPRRGLIV